MNTFQFGALPKKTFEVTEEGNISVSSKLYGSGDYSATEIDTIYIQKATTMEHGKVYLSFDGESVHDPILKVNGFNYSKKQNDTVDEFLALLESFNEDIDTLEGRLEQDEKATKKQKVNKKAIKCPKCKSLNVDYMGNNKKGFSVGKAVAGGVLTGGVGSLAGFAGKKGKEKWHCKDCGEVFKTK